MSTLGTHIHVKRIEPSPSAVYDTYWKFAAERQAIFYRRLIKANPPWTDDIILRVYKFTNAYRAADRVSQYLISRVIEKGEKSPKELLFRILLFKMFNKIETWHFLENRLGNLSWKNFDFKKYTAALEAAKNSNGTIYSAAYIMASGKSTYGYSYKHENHLRLIERMLLDGLAEVILKATSMEQVYEILKAYPTFGAFLAYQVAIDINYSPLTSFSEMTFVKAGPGARDGISKCFVQTGDYSAEDVIKWMADRQELEFERLGIHFDGLWGRPLQLIDCQNLFCEVDKYARVAHPEVLSKSSRMRIKQKFSPTINKLIHYLFPEEWKMDTSVIPNKHQYE